MMDTENSEEIQDPRFAYIKTCKEQKVLPKAGMLIREKLSMIQMLIWVAKHANFSSFGLLNRSSIALSEAIKRYTLPLESVDFSDNGMRPRESKNINEDI